MPWKLCKIQFFLKPHLPIIFYIVQHKIIDCIDSTLPQCFGKQPPMCASMCWFWAAYWLLVLKLIWLYFLCYLYASNWVNQLLKSTMKNSLQPHVSYCKEPFIKCLAWASWLHHSLNLGNIHRPFTWGECLVWWVSAWYRVVLMYFHLHQLSIICNQ